MRKKKGTKRKEKPAEPRTNDTYPDAIIVSTPSPSTPSSTPRPGRTRKVYRSHSFCGSERECRRSPTSPWRTKGPWSAGSCGARGGSKCCWIPMRAKAKYSFSPGWRVCHTARPYFLLSAKLSTWHSHWVGVRVEQRDQPRGPIKRTNQGYQQSARPEWPQSPRARFLEVGRFRRDEIEEEKEEKEEEKKER